MLWVPMGRNNFNIYNILYYIILYILILVYIVFQLSLLMVRRCVLSVICQLSPVASIENSLYFSSILCFSTCFFKKSAKSFVFHFLSSYFCRVPAGSRGRHTYRLAWAIVYYWARAVESLSTVINDGSHAFFVFGRLFKRKPAVARKSIIW